MTYSKVNNKISKQHPIHVLQESAKEIVSMWKAAMADSGVNDPQLTIPIWVADNETMLITIEVGTKTDAEYAIFKAQTK